MIRSYLRLALKVLARRRFFTFISLFGIAFTLMVLMVVAAMLDELYTPRAPEVHLSRTLFVTHARALGEMSQSSGSPGYRMLDTVLRDLDGAETVSLFSTVGSNGITYLNGEKIALQMRSTDGVYWSVLDFTFLEGRPLTEEDDRNGNAVAVITRSTRKRIFGDDDAVGRTLTLGGRGFEVVGVTEDVPVFRREAFAEIWVPTGSALNQDFRDHWISGFNAMILAEDRGEFVHIRDQIYTNAAAIRFDTDRFHTAEVLVGTRLEDMSREMFAGNASNYRVGRFIAALVGAALLFMLLPAINLVNINISRITERTSEIGVRKAFGASSAHLVGQFVIENIVLCILGGLIGLLAAHGLLQLINTNGWIPYADFQLNWRLFLVAVTLSTAFGILSGTYPAWRMSRLHPIDALNGGSR